MASVTRSTKTDGSTYAEVVQQMQNAGMKTTRIKQGKEADFEDYGNALSPEVKKMLMDSFDCEQDYALQQQLASLFSNSHDVKNGDFMKLCKKMGLTVTRQSVKTTYISDYKGGNKSNSVRNGHISVFTISDGKGGEIKIADTNGNGAIESEELFMNQILGDINAEISQISPNLVSLGESGSVGISALEETIGAVSQEEFNKKVEEQIKAGKTKAEAELSAGIELNALDMSYTGFMQDEIEKVGQQDYNEAVEALLKNGYSTTYAENLVDFDLGTNKFKYTGSMEEQENAIGSNKYDKYANDARNKAAKLKGYVGQKDYNDEIEKKIYRGENATDAIEKTQNELNTYNMKYTGFNLDLQEIEKEKEKENIFLAAK